MEAIAPTLPTDVEDVVWALQTADALWKRNERREALVWLKRAADAATSADQPERALALSRRAAELSADASAIPSKTTAAAAAPVTPAPSLPPPLPPSASKLRLGPPQPAAAAPRAPVAPGKLADAPALKRSVAPKAGVDVPPSPFLAEPAPKPAPPVEPAAPRVPTAAESHAGMLDPWADADSKRSSRGERAPDRAGSFEDDEVITSAKPLPRTPPVRRADAPTPSLPVDDKDLPKS